MKEDKDRYTYLYYEFMSGGDSFYGGTAPITSEDWLNLSLDKKAELAEQTLNQAFLKIRYPGTFNGPRNEDLRMLIHLDKIESFECDSMMVTSYTTLLKLPNLRSISVDVFDHFSGYHANEWSVFDALIFIKTQSFRSKLDHIDQYRQELDLESPLGMPEKAEASEELTMITESYLYEHFSLRKN
jgi:hypothetical protein